MKKVLAFTVLFFTVVVSLWTQEVKTVKDAGGSWTIEVDGKPIFVKGVVWSVTPPGTNFTYSLWKENDKVIRSLIDRDGQLMKDMGVNAVRVSSEIPAKYVEYMFSKHGIYTIIVDSFGRNGVSVQGRRFDLANFERPEHRAVVLAQARATVEKFKGTKGILMYLFGNEMNYRTYWPDTPKTLMELPGDTRSERRNYALYTALEEAMKTAKEIDPAHPVGFINGDIGNLDVMAEVCPSMDIFGTNLSRGARIGNVYDEVQWQIDRPVLIAQISPGDAWNAKLNREDQYHQAEFIVSQWTDIYANAYGAGHANSVGGVVNEWTDSWWGHNPGSTAGLDVHDTDADYLNWAYFNDVLYPYPNVNPEWGGLTSQGKRKIGRHPIKQPRAAYYALQYLWKVDPVQLAEERTKGTAGGVTLESHLAGLDLGTFTARGMTDSQENIPNWKVTTDISFAAMQSGNNIEQRLDEGEEFIMLFDNNSSPNNTNIWGGEVKTTLWGITNESAAGRLEGAATVAVRHDVVTGEGYSSIINQTTSSALKERPVDFYSGWFKWSGAGAAVNGFYHVGHASWEGQGDFFSIIPESYDITGYDKLNNKAPIGVEASYNFGLSGNQGLAVLLGPEPYYGSGPLAALKWYQKIENVSFSALYSQGFAAYNKETKKVEKPESMASLWTSWQPKMPQNGSFRADIGMLSAGWQKIGDTFEVAPDKKGEITLADTLGVKARLQYSPIQYFATQMQFDYAGLVADTNGGTTPIGSLLADNGHGNRIEAKGGVTGSYGNYQLRLNALWRQPIIGPIADTTTARALAQANPFYVSGNREALRFEAILSYDSEPGSWLWAYNNADLEGGVFAGSLIARYTAWEGATDPGHYKQDDGTRMWYSTGLSRVENEFSAALRTVFNPLPDLRIVNSAALIKGQAIAGTWNTERDSRLITGFQEDLKVRYQRLVVDVLLAFDLWGTVSWQRDMNYTYPMRWASELAWSFRPVPSLMNSSDRVGLRWRGVIRDHFSPKFTELGKDSHEIELFFNITI